MYGLGLDLEGRGLSLSLEGPGLDLESPGLGLKSLSLVNIPGYSESQRSELASAKWNNVLHRDREGVTICHVITI